MKRASIVGAFFVGLLGLPFLGAGLVFLFQFASRGGAQGWMVATVSLFFACIGLLLIAVAIGGIRIARQQDATRTANPDKPWLWRRDWAEGRANGGDPRANITAWVFTAFWDVISAFLAFTVLPKLLQDRDPMAIFAAVFPLAGILITAFAARGTLRIWRYGRTSFWCDSVPFSPGGHVKGFIRLKLPTSAPHGFDLRLSCKRHVVTGMETSRSVEELVLWQADQNVPAKSVMPRTHGVLVPVEFALPIDACETGKSNPDDRVYWQLNARADIPGVDFSDKYELPVFRTPAWAAAETTESSGASSGSSAARPEGESPAPAPARTHIVYREDERGVSFYFPPLRKYAQSAGAVASAAIWSGIVYILWSDPHAPWLFRIVFSLFEVPIACILLSVVFGSALIRVDEGVLQIRRAILGIGSWQRIPFHEVTSISPSSEGHTSTSGEMLYGISIKKSDGSESKLLTDSLSKAEARWIVSTVERAMGRLSEVKLA